MFEAFKSQLTKDMEQSNCPADFVTLLKPDYNSILEKISNELQRNEKRSDFNVMQLLYRVDISEAQLKRCLTEAKNENHYDVIAELIIKRVLQKVVTRKFYKSKENF